MNSVKIKVLSKKRDDARTARCWFVVVVHDRVERSLILVIEYLAQGASSFPLATDDAAGPSGDAEPLLIDADDVLAPFLLLHTRRGHVAALSVPSKTSGDRRLSTSSFFDLRSSRVLVPSSA